MFKKEIFYLDDENKNEFYKQLYTYTPDYYATKDKRQKRNDTFI